MEQRRIVKVKMSGKNQIGAATPKPALVVLAAGLGSRYGKPKQVEGLGPSGEYLIEYTILDAIRSGFGRIVIVTRSDLASELESRFVSKVRGLAECHFVVQNVGEVPEGLPAAHARTKPWGTGHAVLITEGVVGDLFAVVNADDFYGRAAISSLHDELVTMEAGDLGACLVVYRLINTLSEFGKVSRGICALDSHRHLVGIEERKGIFADSEGLRGVCEDGEMRRMDGQELTSMNLMGFTRPAFGVLKAGFRRFLEEGGLQDPGKEYFLPDALSSIAGSVPVKVRVSEDKWVGVTFPKDAADVSAYLKNLTDRGEYPARFWS